MPHFSRQPGSVGTSDCRKPPDLYPCTAAPLHPCTGRLLDGTACGQQVQVRTVPRSLGPVAPGSLPPERSLTLERDADRAWWGRFQPEPKPALRTPGRKARGGRVRAALGVREGSSSIILLSPSINLITQT